MRLCVHCKQYTSCGLSLFIYEITCPCTFLSVGFGTSDFSMFSDCFGSGVDPFSDRLRLFLAFFIQVRNVNGTLYDLYNQDLVKIFSKNFRFFFENFSIFLKTFRTFRSFEHFSRNRLRRDDSFGPKIVEFRAILGIFRSFEDFYWSG